MSLALRYAARSDVGLLRDINEDSVYAGPRLLAVADGMGGHAAGEVASAVTIASLAPLDEDAPGADLLAALRGAVDTAQAHLREMVAADNALDGMGTTLTALLWAGSRLGLAHVGDSRAYLFRDGELHQITHDHTLVQLMVDEGRITPDEAGSHPQRSLITRALDGRGEVEPDLSVRDARVGDRYLLCTDGLSGVVTQTTMQEALGIADPEQVVERLVELALRGGGPDNVTCIVADVVEAARPGDDAVVVAGAAAADRSEAAPSAETAAGRAALFKGRRDRGRQTRSARWARSDRGRVERPRRSRRRPLLAALAAVVTLTAVAVGALLWMRSQYYVGVDHANVAIFQGLSGSVAGLELSSLHERLPVAVAALPPFERDRVRAGISAGGLSEARRITDRLRSEQRSAGCPTPAASPSDTTTPSPTPVPSCPPGATP